MTEVDFRTRELPFSNTQTQVEKAKSIGEQLSRDLEFYADRGVGGRSRPFRSLTRFWVGIVCIVCIGAVTLELLGPPARNDHVSDAARPSGLAGNGLSEPGSAGTTLAPAAAFYRSAAPPRQASPSAASPEPNPAPVGGDVQQGEQQAVSAAGPASIAGASALTPDARQAAFKPPRLPLQPPVSEPTMVTLPGATLRMGSNDDHSERPVHAVVVAPFLIAKSATTVREWQECVEARSCTLQPKGRPEQPVTNVSWDDAQRYVAWLATATGKRYRLPTEAEWEYAARAGTETRYYWGSAMLPGKASCKGCGEPVSVQNPPKADAYPPNPFGLYGMGGGVAEWVADCWHRDYQDAPHDGSAAWDVPDCRERVLRGGSWMADANYLRPSSRDTYDASVRYPTHGFRVARTE